MTANLKVPVILSLLAWVCLALAVTSLVTEVVGGCGGCGAPSSVGLVVAGAGVVGYAVLIALAAAHRRALFAFGVIVAGAAHTVLLLWMAVEGRLCWICLACGAAALANTILALGRVADTALAERIYVPSVIAFSSLVFAVLLAGAKQKAARENELVNRTAIARTLAAPFQSAALRLTVYESDHCSYCQTFKDDYEPELARDFGSALDIRHVNARDLAWVERTPTIVIENGAVFEGLPPAYADLKSAVESARRRESK